MGQVRERADKGMPSYASAGELQFIDWNDTIEPDSPTLKWRREGRLATKLIDPLQSAKESLPSLSKTPRKELGC